MIEKDRNSHAFFMREAIALAKMGVGQVNPNPLVGAVLVKDGTIIAKGYHTRFGALHAEREVFASLADPAQAQGADLYVTLEPCCHHGKQPPCTEAVIAHKIARVFVGSADPNPLVAGKGCRQLRKHGIEVYEGVLKEECDALNDVFFHYIQTKKPYVVLKYAMTMDGKIATVSGKSRWITGETARQRVHEDRNRYMAIMVGIQTVLTDDPLLNCRMEGGRNPIRIICDSHLRIPEDSQLVRTANQYPLWIACVKSADSQIEEKAERLKALGCHILSTEADATGCVNLKQLMEIIGEAGVDSILLEGGARLHEAALKSQIVQKVQSYIAPKLFGGAGAPSPVGGIGVDAPEEAWFLKNSRITQLGDDVLIESEVLYPCLQES